jgi:hypothetical protein
VPVDVSIPLLLKAADSARALLHSARPSSPIGAHTVLPLCADFEEGQLNFARRLATTARAPGQGIRLITLLGNTFGNLRDEEGFVRQKLWPLARRGDFVWLEVGVRLPQTENDPLFPLTLPNRSETAGEASRRLLLEGPYRRWEAAMGRRPSELEMRVWLREDDESCRVPGAINFCHDLLIRDERRVCTMLYSRRYQVEALTQWFERLEFSVERVARVDDSRQQARVVHLLLRRR